MPRIRPRTVLYRNYDQSLRSCWHVSLPNERFPLSLLLADTAFGFALTVTDEDDNSVTLSFPHQKEPARTPAGQIICVLNSVNWEILLLKPEY